VGVRFSYVQLITQTKDSDHPPWRCHGIVIVLYNRGAANSEVIRDAMDRGGRRDILPLMVALQRGWEGEGSPKRTPLGHYFQYVKRDGSLPQRDVSYMIASQHIEW